MPLNDIMANVISRLFRSYCKDKVYFINIIRYLLVIAIKSTKMFTLSVIYTVRNTNLTWTINQSNLATEYAHFFFADDIFLQEVAKFEFFSLSLKRTI